MAFKILFVDDEPQFERLIKQRLRQYIKKGSFELTFANNGLDALDIVSNQSDLDLIITDLNMPHMDGFAFLERMKKLLPQKKVVVLSAYFDPSSKKRAYDLGVVEFVTKPINFTDLIRCIKANCTNIPC